MPLLAHALPVSVGAVPLTLVLVGILVVYLGGSALYGRALNDRIGTAVRADAVPVWGRGAPGLTVGWVILVTTVLLAILGPSDPAQNLTDVAVMTLGFGFVALTSLAVGGWWVAVDPVRPMADLLTTGNPRPIPDHVATFAPAVLLLGWAWVELLIPLSVISFAILLLVYVVGHALAAARYGDVWLVDVEPVNVLSKTLGLLSPRGGSPLARLSSAVDNERLRLVAAVLIAWSLADLILETEWWHDLGLNGSTTAWLGPLMLVGTAALLYLLIRLVSARAGLGPAFVAVAAAWVIGQYLSLLLIEGQGITIWLSDPLGSGADLLGRTGDTINLEPLPVGLMSALQMVPFVGGHLVAGAVAQRRAAARVKTAAQVGTITFGARALIAILLLVGTWLQLGGL